MTNYFTNTKFKIGQPVYVQGYQGLYRIFQIDEMSRQAVYHLVDRDGVRGSAYDHQLTAFKNTQKQMQTRIRSVYTRNETIFRGKSSIRRTHTA